ncbi:MAG: flagellar hook-basal body complex protein FliE [Gammaproteobacteria bacterium]|nr:flagellar hook-basal body complex protein FliE [Gammaproteobacteria bacterium]MDH5593772.1 flagellar hook-basal body complex protein FliE [Gammaproteobacteria bacterium]MDH5613709.1 flagellar hook-basal body complex protein FliE [Gammaproteobacteria bacterium]
MKPITADQLLAQMKSITQAAQGSALSADKKTESVDFSNMLKSAMDTVNTHQQKSREMKTAFELGDPNVDLSQVMISMQKASISFQAMVQVRNKLVNAYQDIMNMPV